MRNLGMRSSISGYYCRLLIKAIVQPNLKLSLSSIVAVSVLQLLEFLGREWFTHPR